MKRLLFVGLLSAMAFEANAGEFRDIVDTCTDLELDRASISAVCTAENGGKYITAIRLRGVSNRDGSLILEQDSAVVSTFHKSCKQASIDSKGMIAGRCLNDDNKYVWSFLDLRPLIKNYNGTLVYPWNE